jgi:preprotein translocase subunit SecG
MFLFLLIVQTLVAIGLITVILMQRSEGGGLAGGGSPSGLMTARGAADFLTRATSVLATIFVVLSIALAALAAQTAGPRTIDPTVANMQGQRPPAGSPLEQQPSPFSGAPQPIPGQPAPGQPAQGQLPGIPTLQPQQPAPAQQAPAPAPAGNSQ